MDRKDIPPNVLVDGIHHAFMCLNKMNGMKWIDASKTIGSII